MKYGYVCTNFNNSHFTAEAIASLQAGAIPPIRIVVVDNNSSPASVDELRPLADRYPNVELVLNSDNIGYFKGLNVGIRRLEQLEPALDLMVIGNNDLIFPHAFGEQLAETLPAIQGFPVVSPDVMTLDGLHQNPHVIKGVSRVREFVYDLYFANYHLAGVIRKMAALTRSFTDRPDETEFDKPQFINQGHGSVYILTRRFFEMFDELWSPTFLMGEEYFLSRQLEERGTQVYYEPRITVKHHCNGSIQNLPSRRMWELSRDAHKIYRRYVKVWGNPLPLPKI